MLTDPILVVDFGMGNLASIANMIGRLGGRADVSSDPDAIARAGKLILPGVGAFDAGMEQLEARGFLEPLRRRVMDDRIPVLGICLGMQLLAADSEEGARRGLGWIAGKVVRFDVSMSPETKIPHMGWNGIAIRRDTPLLAELPADPRFYFVHGYHLRPGDMDDVAATTEYGTVFPSVVARGNVLGVQFHPEKSHRYGKALLRNFMERY